MHQKSTDRQKDHVDEAVEIVEQIVNLVIHHHPSPARVVGWIARKVLRTYNVNRHDPLRDFDGLLNLNPSLVRHILDGIVLHPDDYYPVPEKDRAGIELVTNLGHEAFARSLSYIDKPSRLMTYSIWHGENPSVFRLLHPKKLRLEGVSEPIGYTCVLPLNQDGLDRYLGADASAMIRPPGERYVRPHHLGLGDIAHIGSKDIVALLLQNVYYRREFLRGMHKERREYEGMATRLLFEHVASYLNPGERMPLLLAEMISGHSRDIPSKFGFTPKMTVSRPEGRHHLIHELQPNNYHEVSLLLKLRQLAFDE